MPADGVYASVLRTTAAALAARLDFTVDDIEDLRIMVSEASALVLPEADPGTDLVSRFLLGAGAMTVEIATLASRAPAPDLDSFAWQVLDALADDATVDTAEGSFRVRFTLTAQRTPGAGDA